MKIITVTGFKGGCGKTTTAVHLARYFAEKAKTVLVDIDVNGSALAWSQRSDGLPFQVVNEVEAVRAVQDADIVIFDTAARPDAANVDKLGRGSDLIILPTLPSVMDIGPMVQTSQAIGSTKTWALITVCPPLPNKDGAALQADLRELHIPVFERVIRRTVEFPRAAKYGKTVKDKYPERTEAADQAWADYEVLGGEVEACV